MGVSHWLLASVLFLLLPVTAQQGKLLEACDHRITPMAPGSSIAANKCVLESCSRIFSPKVTRRISVLI